jgi:hypothetical protein
VWDDYGEWMCVNYECGRRKVTKTVQISAVVWRMKSWGFVRIMACSKDEWNSERIWAALCVANMNEAQIEHQWNTQWQGQFIGNAGINMSDETETLWTGVPCEVCECCGALTFKAETGWTVHFPPSLFIPKMRGRKGRGRRGSEGWDGSPQCG